MNPLAVPLPAQRQKVSPVLYMLLSKAQFLFKLLSTGNMCLTNAAFSPCHIVLSSLLLLLLQGELLFL